jgi:tRNA (cmo5U34)-methyltransferase
MANSQSATNSGWDTSNLDRFFIDNVQSGQPFITELHDIMLRLIAANEPANASLSFLDLGCGNGFLSKSIVGRYPEGQGVLVDFSEHMLNIAHNALKENRNLSFVQLDLSGNDWVGKLDRKSFDAIVSGFAIHNFRTSDESRREFYSQILGLLRPGGLFVDLELVYVTSIWVLSVCRQLQADSLTEFHKKKGTWIAGRQVMEEFARLEGRGSPFDPKRLPSHTSVEIQCELLRQVGFVDVDCYFRFFNTAVFGGRRPK